MLSRDYRLGAQLGDDMPRRRGRVGRDGHVELDLAAERECHVFPVFQYRFNAPVQRIRRGIQDGELGDPRIISIRQRWCRTQEYYDQGDWRGTYSLDGGALTNQGIHHLDLIQYLQFVIFYLFRVDIVLLILQVS